MAPITACSSTSQPATVVGSVSLSASFACACNDGIMAGASPSVGSDGSTTTLCAVGTTTTIAIGTSPPMTTTSEAPEDTPTESPQPEPTDSSDAPTTAPEDPFPNPPYSPPKRFCGAFGAWRSGSGIDLATATEHIKSFCGQYLFHPTRFDMISF